MDTHKVTLVYEQIKKDNIVKQCCNNIEYLFIGEVILVKDSVN